MKIIGAASAFPKHYYPQAVLLEALQRDWADKLPNPEMLRRLHSRTGVDGRFLCLPVEEYFNLRTWGDFNRAWVTAAEELGSQALCRALTRAHVEPDQLGALIFMSVTGISSPSIDAKLI